MTWLDYINPFSLAIILGLAFGFYLALYLATLAWPPEEPGWLYCAGCGRLVATIGEHPHE